MGKPRLFLRACMELSGHCRLLAPPRTVRSVGEEHIGSDIKASLAKDSGESGRRFVSELWRLSSGRRSGMLPTGWDDRGVKNLPNRRGVTDGFRRSLPRRVREGERYGPAGEELIFEADATAEAGGLEGIVE